MLGCKSNKRLKRIERARELIDTCWDVNLPYKPVILCMFFELIDTCWDVNIIGLSLNNRGLGINRYMLGCKFLIMIFTIIILKELIDTCWDVNLRSCKVNKHGAGN